MTDLTDRQIMILLAIRDKKTLQQMIDIIGAKSFRTAQEEVESLIELGLARKVANEAGNTKIKGRELTPEGRRWLKNHGHTVS